MMNRSRPSHIRIIAVDDDQAVLGLYLQSFLPERFHSLYALETDAYEPTRAPCVPIPSSIGPVDLVLCRQGDEAVEKVREAVLEDRPFRIAFIDMRIPPGPTGIWTAQHIRALDPFIHIVVVTAHSDISPFKIAGLVGPPDKLLYLQKPFHLYEIQQFTSALNAKWLAERALRESENQLKYLSSQLLIAQEKERKRIANEIHDSVGQSLHVLKAGMEGLTHEIKKGNLTSTTDSLQELMVVADFAIEEVRNIYMDLRPSLLDDLGILATINWFLREFSKSHPHIHIEKRIGIGEEEVHEALKIIVFRILQGALDNIAQHSHADFVQIWFGKRAGRMELSIQDNGIGFDPGDSLIDEKHRNGLGIVSMQERTESSGGFFTIRSIKGAGTSIYASWPLTLKDSREKSSRLGVMEHHQSSGLLRASI